MDIKRLLNWNRPRGDICTELNVERYDLRKDGTIGYSHPNGKHDDVFWSIALAVYATVECRIHKAILKAKLEPFLGVLHSVQYGKPSLVCDFQELYRYLIDDFLIERCRKLRKKDFVLVTDFMMHLKMGKKIHLKEYEVDSLAEDLKAFFDRMVDVERIKVGKRQTIDTLINEEALLFAKYLREERKDWFPRIAGTLLVSRLYFYAYLF